MNAINVHVGERIRMYRKVRGITIKELAEEIHKSKGTVSKYETGEITLDVPTLCEICKVLAVSTEQILDMEGEEKTALVSVKPEGKSLFYLANRLYFYFYDGRYQRLKDGIIDIKERQPGEYQATLSIRAKDSKGEKEVIFYSGKVFYSDMLIRFSFVNRYNAMEEDLLYIFNPLEHREVTDGLLCGISSADYLPCAFRCLVSLKELPANRELKERLLFTREELLRWQKQNMLTVDNKMGGKALPTLF